MSTARWVVVAAVVVVVAGGCATVAPDGSALQGTGPTEAQRRACERNGGYWATAAGFCRIGA